MKNTARQYYLNRRVKKFTKLKSTDKTIFTTEQELTTLSDQQKKYINELQQNFGYVVQYTIPE